MNTQSCAIVILGASGDLARRKLIPALGLLYNKGILGDSYSIVGSGRSDFSDEKFRERLGVTGRFAERVVYHRNIPGLKAYIASKIGCVRVVFFLALPPQAYSATARELRAEGFGPEATLIIEKPFGYDYESARSLNRDLTACFDESQLFRIDHFLAKEAVQNILVFRFANALFQPIWNDNYIESIQINALEEIGVADRVAYFDKAGIIRDMVQNHLLQLLSLLAMEAPLSLSAEDLRRQKIDLLRAVSVVASRRSQCRGYRSEKGVAPGSDTETYAELTLRINNFRWSGTPVYLRTGKAMHRHGTEIGIRLRRLPKLLFNKKGDVPPNQIIFKIQPAAGIILDVSNKIPGEETAIAGTHITFCYRDAFGDKGPDAYERLIRDAIEGDRTLFVSAEETEIAWKILDPVIGKGELDFYDRGALPPPALFSEWIDFDRYVSVCS